MYILTFTTRKTLKKIWSKRQDTMIPIGPNNVLNKRQGDFFYDETIWGFYNVRGKSPNR